MQYFGTAMVSLIFSDCFRYFSDFQVNRVAAFDSYQRRSNAEVRMYFLRWSVISSEVVATHFLAYSSGVIPPESL